jgi:hypothetical protein
MSFDAAYAYEYPSADEIGEVEPWTHQDLEVQTRSKGSAWHRRAIGGRATACGEPLDPQFHLGLRHESYHGELCRDGCFSAYELALSDEANAEDQERFDVECR